MSSGVSQKERALQLTANTEEPDRNTLVAMLRAMLLTRLFDTKALNMQRQGRIGFYVPCNGQEAAQIGSAFALGAGDWTLPTYRDLGVAIARGEPLDKLMAHLMGNSDDSMLGRQMPSHWGFKEINFLSVASPIASHLPVAVGIAMAMKHKGEDKVVVAYLGDGATSEGDFHAACNFAGVYKAPVVFVCENNGWAISVPVQRQTASSTLAQKALAYGFEGVRVDGNDVLAVYRATKVAVERARAGRGPTLIECLTYRMGPHSTSDDPNRYRSREELEEWRKRDGIERFRSYLRKAGKLSADDEASMQRELESELNAAIEKEERSPPPSIGSIFSDVYYDEPPALREQRQEAEFHMSSDEGGR